MKHAILNRDFGNIRTVAVFGIGRSGTSVIAGTLRVLGIQMGTNPHMSKHEWSPLTYQPDGSIDWRQSQRTIETLDRDNTRWGWKSPRDVFSIEQVAPFLRDPGFIIVTRDLLEASLSSQVHQNVPLEISFYENSTVYRWIADRLRFWPWPILLVSFTEILANRENFIEVLCEFLRIEPDQDRRKRAANFVQSKSTGYRPLEARPDEKIDFISEEDLKLDSQQLAAHFSARYAGELLRHVESMMKDAAAALDLVGAKDLPSFHEELWQAESLNFPCKTTEVAPLPEKVKTASELLDCISEMAKRAYHDVEARQSADGYGPLLRLHRALKLLIRMRVELQRALDKVNLRG